MNEKTSAQLYGLSKQQIQAIQRILKSHAKVNQAILYGSRAKGNYRPNSDIDLSLQGPELLFSDLAKISSELDDLLLPYLIDLSIYHQIKNSNLVQQIDQTGIVFYSKARP